MTEEEIKAIAAKHRMTRFPNLALTRERLSRKAKAEPKFRFYTLYGRVMDEETLRCAWRCVRKAKKAPGVDGVACEDIERSKGGVEGFLASIQAELKAKTYRASPVRRVYIKKANGKLRPLGIPTVKDRVVQTAVNLATRRFAGTAVGFTSLFSYGSVLFSGWGMGFLAERTGGWATPFLAVVGATIFGAGLFLALWNTKPNGYEEGGQR